MLWVLTRDASDAGLIVDDPTKSYNGYSNIEVYANSLLGEWAEFSTKPTVTNTEISIDSINNGTDNVYVKSNDVQLLLRLARLTMLNTLTLLMLRITTVSLNYG